MAKIKVFDRTVFLKDVVIAFLIAVLPFMFYLYKLAPNNSKIWETPFFIFESKYYENVEVFLWTLSTKLLTLIILVIWFLTCKHWWKYTIIIGISIEMFKILSTLNVDIQFSDNFEFIYSLPITIPIILLLLFLSRKLNYYSQAKSLNNELNEEIEELLTELSDFNLEDYKSLRKDLNVLRANKIIMDKSEYLKQLIVLRDKLVQL